MGTGGGRGGGKGAETGRKRVQVFCHFKKKKKKKKRGGRVGVIGMGGWIPNPSRER